jgi:anti-anti-sigma factor
MFAWFFTRWFSRPVERAPLTERPQVAAAGILPTPCAPRPPASALVVEVNQASGDMVIRVKGEARADCAGALEAGLLAPAAQRPAAVTLDLSELRCLSSLCMGVLVAYRRGVVRTGGRVRLAEPMQQAVKEALTRAELLALFEAAADAEQAAHRKGSPTSAIVAA